MAIARFMWVIATHEAEQGTTVTCDFLENLGQVLSLTAELTLHIWAPFDVNVVIGEWLWKPFPVCFLVLWAGREESLKRTMGYLHVAPVLHAITVNALEAGTNFFSEVLGPAFIAESVFAVQSIATWVIDCTITYLTISAMLCRQRHVHMWVLFWQIEIKFESKSELEVVLLCKPILHFVLVPVVVACDDD